MALTLSLASLERWLRERAPTTHESLRPPATLASIDSAVDELGFRLLPDLQRLWLWHDGSANLPISALDLHPGHHFLSIRDCIDEWQSRLQVSGASESRSWNSLWVPITSDGAGNHIVVDHQVGEHIGSVFLADLQNGPMRHRGWPSLTGLIDNLNNALSQQAMIDGHNPRIDEGGRLVWDFVPLGPHHR